MNSSRGFAALALDVAVLGHAQRIHPALVWDSGSAALVDSGYSGKEGELLAQAREALGDLEHLAALVVTHQDIDHIGGGEGILARLGRPIPVYAHELDAPYIRGEKLLIKLASMGEASGFKPEIPAGVPPEKVKAFLAALARPPRLRVTDEVRGETRLPLAGGIRLIPTPGHTPGHLCLYHEPSRTLVAGDALVAAGGRLELPPPALCWDPAMARTSLGRLTGLAIERVICYHGGLVEAGAAERLRELAAEP